MSASPVQLIQLKKICYRLSNITSRSVKLYAGRYWCVFQITFLNTKINNILHLITDTSIIYVFFSSSQRAQVDCRRGGRLSFVKTQNIIRQNRDISVACYLQQSYLITPPALSISCNGTISCAVRCLFIRPLTPKWQRRE